MVWLKLNWGQKAGEIYPFIPVVPPLISGGGGKVVDTRGGGNEGSLIPPKVGEYGSIFLHPISLLYYITYIPILLCYYIAYNIKSFRSSWPSWPPWPYSTSWPTWVLWPFLVTLALLATFSFWPSWPFYVHVHLSIFTLYLS